MKKPSFEGLFLVVLRFARATEYVDEFVANAFGDESSAVAEILTGIEVRGVFGEVLARCGGESETEVGVDVDLANSH